MFKQSLTRDKSRCFRLITGITTYPNAWPTIFNDFSASNKPKIWKTYPKSTTLKWIDLGLFCQVETHILNVSFQMKKILLVPLVCYVGHGRIQMGRWKLVSVENNKTGKLVETHFLRHLNSQFLSSCKKRKCLVLSVRKSLKTQIYDESIYLFQSLWHHSQK